ncbi:MAG: hypothetical protein KGI66_04220, partial [Patescibacteria group bacterium]|nr:hypothetical protein [Patescibacteria group bacterium]
CRSRRLEARFVDRQWYIDPQALLAYKKRAEEAQSKNGYRSAYSYSRDERPLLPPLSKSALKPVSKLAPKPAAIRKPLSAIAVAMMLVTFAIGAVPYMSATSSGQEAASILGQIGSWPGAVANFFSSLFGGGSNSVLSWNNPSPLPSPSQTAGPVASGGDSLPIAPAVATAPAAASSPYGAIHVMTVPVPSSSAPAVIHEQTVIEQTDPALASQLSALEAEFHDYRYRFMPLQVDAIANSIANAVAAIPPASSSGGGSGSVTSIAASGGTTGLTFSGSPITSSGTLTLGGTLGVANGGTGQTSFGQGLLGIDDAGAFISTTSPTVSYIVATSSIASILPYASTTVLSASTLCLSSDCRTAWPSGGSGTGASSWSTTTSQVAGELVNYSLNNTDIVAIGGSSTTTAPFWFDPNKLTASLSGNVGIGTTSPFTALSVNGSAFFGGSVTADSFNATDTSATSTFAGGLTVGNNGLVYDSNSGVTTISSLTTGNMSFETDAGAVNWVDLPIDSTPSNGTVERYSASLNGTPMLTVFGQADGAGNIKNAAVGIGTTSPWSLLSVGGQSEADNFYAASTSATSTFAGGLNVGNGAITYDWNSGTTSIPYLETGNMNFAADSGVVSWIDMPVTSASASGVAESYSANLAGNPLLTIYGQSNGAGGVQNTAVGIGTTSPNWLLSVAGNGSFDNYVRASYFVATSSTASTLPYASTTAITITGTASTTNLIVSNTSSLGNATTTSLGIGSLTGLLQANAGSVSAVAAGTNGQTLALVNGVPTWVATTTLSNISGTLAVSNGGTGATSFAGGWLYSAGGTSALVSSSSPTVNYLVATSTTATSTFAGGLTIGTNGLVYDSYSGITTISALQTGGMSFPTDAGALTWTDLPIDSTPANGTVESYSADLNGNPMLTVFGQADGAGNIKNAAVGIGTTSPWSLLSVAGQSEADNFYAASTTATSTFAGSVNIGNGSFVYDNTGGTTTISNLQLGNLSFDTDAGVVSAMDMPVDSAAAAGTPEAYNFNLNASPILTVYSQSDGAGSIKNTAVGIGTTSPNWLLSVAGTGSFDNYVRASYFTATSTTATSTLAGGLNVAGASGLTVL